MGLSRRYLGVRTHIMLRRAGKLRWISWMAMLAMLLIAVAPAVSQLVMAGQPMHHVMADASALCPEHASQAGDHAGMPDHDMAHGDACGYCSLFSHTPLNPTITALPAIAWVAPEPAHVAWSVHHAVSPLLLNAAPRGPPDFLLG